ncbi:MAG: hypothetical protein CSA33_07555 [Desulfobulbus propionicus]|nr:MAG: hypothetical protein CSA33_07555 [Desulfobulbus propionicus]
MTKGFFFLLVTRRSSKPRKKALTIFRFKPAESYSLCFVRGKFMVEFAKTLGKNALHLLQTTLVLKTAHIIIGKPNQVLVLYILVYLPFQTIMSASNT